MPDNTDFRIPSKKFERKFGKKSRSPVDTKGGILFPDNYKSIVVNIRPKNWQERFWIGRIDNYVDAQFIADLVYYYIGFPCFHLQDVNFDYPPLECEGTSTPLTSREMCFEYAMSIAKGPKSQRQEFIESVKKLAVEEVNRVEVQRVLQQFRDEKVGEHEEEEDVQSDQCMEVDVPKHLPLVLTSYERITRNADGLNAHVLGFDMCDTEFQWQSASSPVSESSWVDAYLAGLKDYDGSPDHGADDLCGATRVLEENSRDCHVGIENIAVNFGTLGDTAAHESGASSSHFLIHDREGESLVSDSHSTHLCISDEFISRRIPCCDGAYSLDASRHPDVMHAWPREMEQPTDDVQVDGW